MARTEVHLLFLPWWFWLVHWEPELMALTISTRKGIMSFCTRTKLVLFTIQGIGYVVMCNLYFFVGCEQIRYGVSSLLCYVLQFGYNVQG